MTAPLSPTAIKPPTDREREFAFAALSSPSTARRQARVARTAAAATGLSGSAADPSTAAGTVGSLGTPLAATKKKTTAKKTTKKKTKKKKLPVCTKKDLKKSKKKRRKCRVVKKKPVAVGKLPSPTGPAAAAPITTPGTGAWTPAPQAEKTDGLRTYRGGFGKGEATRLLFRAGFGPLPGQADEFAGLGVEAAVERLINPPAGAQLVGPAPDGDFLVGGNFAPEDHWGHGHLEWLDRMARSTDQLGERMTLVLHDWLAISASGAESKGVHSYIQLLRSGWRGSFRTLMQDLTVHPAMLEWLNGLGSRKGDANENYARELQELFCLGADRGAYTEQDVREFARALTGWTADWSDALGLHNFRFVKNRWDSGIKTFYAGKAYEKKGAFGTTDAVNAVIDHPMHPSYVALRLWGAFIPTAPTAQTLAELEALYRSSGEQLQPLVRAILLHPDLYNGPSMTKSPATYVAGLLRSRSMGIDTEAWTWICGQAGQMLWYPPNVSGWNERAWLNTTTYDARWSAATTIVNDWRVEEAAYVGSTETPDQAVDAALAFWGNPFVSTAHRAALLQHATQSMQTSYWNNARAQRAMRQNTLRMLVVAAPDHQVS
ncbi:MAG: DUF1800 family protein [Solirubrobacteraceae bacterium]|nr:DUF1800 family protein [Solirubrobacteraceae bacterium]